LVDGLVLTFLQLAFQGLVFVGWDVFAAFLCLYLPSISIHRLNSLRAPPRRQPQFRALVQIMDETAYLSLCKHLLSLELHIPQFLVMSQSHQFLLLLKRLKLILQRLNLGSQILVANI